MDLTVVIVNWNTRDYLEGCLRSLEAVYPWLAGGEGPLALEVVVVENASTDGSAAMVRQHFPWVRLFDIRENLGWAGGNNQGLKAAMGRYSLLLNPDTEVLPGSLEVLVSFMDAHPEAGAAGAKLLNPDGSLQPSCRSFPSPEGVLWEATKVSRLFPHSRRFAAYRMTWFGYDRVMEVDQPMGSALLLRRAAVDAVGLMDEGFPIFFNEVDWCYRAKQAGWRIYFVPDARIVHYGGQSTSQVRPQAIEESHRSMVRFYEKHYRGRIPGPIFAVITWMIRYSAAGRIARAKRGR
ncbi:MAG TPA: glycosyltransferase family 2 protein [Armatimonadota bacterium]|jgi:hypothetical protein